MFEIIPVNDKDVIAVKATGKLTDADYRTFLPELEKLIQQSGPVSLYVELEDFQGWEVKAALDDLRFGLQHDKDFRRIAIVGGNSWEHSGVGLANLFTRTRIRYFSKDDAKAAWDWLREAQEKQMPVKPVKPYRHILLATDFSAYSELAAQRAIELSRQYDARLEVLHIIEEVAIYTDLYDPVIADIPLQDEALKEQADSSMQKFIEKTGLPETISRHVEWGRPKWSIVSWARENEVDLVVLGSHGRHGLARLLGSVSSGVLHQSSCDVLVVKS